MRSRVARLAVLALAGSAVAAACTGTASAPVEAETGFTTMAVSADGEWLVVTVDDEGVGIPPDQLPLIFTKFYRRAGHGAPSGTGLGLFIARGLVEAHGGRIWADSAPGRGTELRFRLPRVGLELAGI